jgi:hypothetical protein
METKALDKIKQMRQAANSLRTFHSHFEEKYEPDARCDKKGYGFGVDSRFSAFKINTHFASWHGYYGSSSCSTALNVQSTEMVEQYLIRAMNVHQRELFATAAKLFQEDAAKLTGDAEKEIAELTNMLQQARDNSEATTTAPVVPKK